MLSLLSIRNFAIIEKLEFSLDTGFTVLTGETGAGKSILLDALNMVLGDRADTSVVRTGCDKAEITAEFLLDALPKVRQWLEERDLDDDDACIVRRVVTAEGRSRGYLNGRSATMQLLRELSEQLVDIHGQHEHQSLLRRPEQLTLLDNFGNHNNLLERVGEYHAEWKIQHTQLENLREAQADRDARLDLLRYQVGELDDFNLQENESATLESEHQRFLHANKLLECTQQALQSTYDNEQTTAYNLLSSALDQLRNAAERDTQLVETCNLFETALINLTEGADNLRNYVDSFNLDPERRDWVENRISTLQQLARKHRTTSEEMPTIVERLRQELDNLENAGERIEQLEANVEDLAQKFSDVASKLSSARKKTAKKLSSNISATMQKLGMQGGKFDIEIDTLDSEFSAQGRDKVEFQVQPNPGQVMKPLRKIASGGELSRISLAIQVITSGSSSQYTMIFDEVDAGVGGGVAELVGRRLRNVAEGCQVLCVTHLPQVASHAHHHFLVSKDLRQKTTTTRIRLLNKEERVEELARMLGGVKITETTREHAREMIQSADKVA